MTQAKHVHSIIDHQVKHLEFLYEYMSEAHDVLLNKAFDFREDVESHVRFMDQNDVAEHMRETDIPLAEWQKLKVVLDTYIDGISKQDDVMTDMFHKFTSFNRARSSDG